MDELHISDENAIIESVKVLQSSHPVVMFQLPTVFVLLAPPTKLGVESLNRTKNRIEGKNYGTAIGDLGQFYAMALERSLPPELDSQESLELLTGAFIKITIGRSGYNTSVSRKGTHQGVLLGSPHRDVFCGIEEGIAALAEPELFNGNKFTAPLCTSANISGDPLGSITDWKRAYMFGAERNVPLVIRSESAQGTLGSYPIFRLTHDKICIDRNGPGEIEIKKMLPQHLFT